MLLPLPEGIWKWECSRSYLFFERKTNTRWIKCRVKNETAHHPWPQHEGDVGAGEWRGEKTGWRSKGKEMIIIKREMK